MDLATLFASLGIKPAPGMGTGAPSFQPAPPARTSFMPGGQADMTMPQAIPAPMPGKPMDQLALQQGADAMLQGKGAATSVMPPQGPQQPGGESGIMKQAMLMIQAALEPDKIAPMADAAGIPAPSAWGGEENGTPWMPKYEQGAYNQAVTTEGAIGDVDPNPLAQETSIAPIQGNDLYNKVAGADLSATIPSLPPIGLPLPGSPGAMPFLSTPPAGAPPVVSAEASPTVPIPRAKPPVPTQPAASGTLDAVKKALSGVKAPDGSQAKTPGSAGVIAPNDYQAAAEFLASIMAGKGAPNPGTTLPFI